MIIFYELFSNVHGETRKVIGLIEYFDHFWETLHLVTGLHNSVLISFWKLKYNELILTKNF